MLETGPVPRSKASQATQRWLAVAVGIAVAGAILAGLLTREVMIDETAGYSMRCGLKTCDATVGTAVRTTSTIALTEDTREGGGKASAAWGWSGTIAWWAGIATLIGLALSIGMVASGKYVRLPLMSPTTIALLGGAIALVCACIFVATKPESVGVTRVGVTFWAFGGGAVGAIVSAFLLSRQLALIEPEFDPGESPEMPPDEPWQDP